MPKLLVFELDGKTPLPDPCSSIRDVALSSTIN